LTTYNLNLLSNTFSHFLTIVWFSILLGAKIGIHKTVEWNPIEQNKQTKTKKKIERKREKKNEIF